MLCVTHSSVLFDFNVDVPHHAPYSASYDVCYYANYDNSVGMHIHYIHPL